MDTSPNAGVSVPLHEVQSSRCPLLQPSAVTTPNNPAVSSNKKRKVNKYNYFCAKQLASANMKNMPMRERMKEVGKEYVALSDEAKAALDVGLSASSREDTTKKLTKELLASRRRIIKEINFLGGHGIAGVCVLEGMPGQNSRVALIENDKAKGNGVARREGWDVVFHNSFKEKGTASTDNLEMNRKQVEDRVRGIFNTKWVEAGFKGKSPSYCKTDSFCLFGLPNDLPFRRPQDYGTKQLRSIVIVRDALHFKKSIVAVEQS